MKCSRSGLAPCVGVLFACLAAWLLAGGAEFSLDDGWFCLLTGFLPLIISRLGISADWILVSWSQMVSFFLASGLSDSPYGFRLAVLGVFSNSLPAAMGLGWKLNSLLELLSSCCEEHTFLR